MQNRTTVRYEYKEYRKLPVISPERIHLSKGGLGGLQTGGGGFISEGVIQTGIEKAHRNKQ